MNNKIDDLSIPPEEPEDNQKNVTVSSIIEELKKLPDQERMVIILTMKGFKNQEIAEILGINKNSVATQKSQTRKKLRKRLTEIDPKLFEKKYEKRRVQQKN